MCGIAGIISKNKRITESDIKAMTDKISHRGPDDAGSFVKDNFALGHRRLSIIDLSASGHQPFFYNDLSIIFNGEIYNYIEVREVLKKEGYIFNTASDTEVITAAYLKWGFDCVKHFNGMWAFALYDPQKNLIFCSRDRFGVKPFYYYQNDSEFIFASEIKALLPRIDSSKVNYSVLMDYMVMGLEDMTSETFYDGVLKLPASHNLVYDLHSHQTTITPYYHIPENDAITKLGIDEAISLFKETLTDAVKLRLRSDVKVGSCLSGGLDSSTIVALASGMYGHSEPFNTINASSIDPKNDESKYAQIVSDYTHSKRSVVKPTIEDFGNLVNDLVYTQEEPFGSLSMLMQYKVFEKAKQEGCTVMLDGQGGDEILLGYSKYYSSLIFSMPFYKWPGVMSMIKKNSAVPYSTVIKNHLYFGYADVRIKRLKNNFSFVKQAYVEQVGFDHLKSFAKSLKNVRQLQEQELFSLQLPHLLRYEDKNSMRHSIESRLPFLDYRVVEVAVNMNNSYKIYNGWSKYPIRKAFEDKLPASISWRKDKIGFAAPEKQMLQDKEKLMAVVKQSPLLSKIFEKSPESVNARQMWRLYNISLWEKTFNVQS